MPISNEELDELLEKLEKIRGRHTELVTVLVPTGANIYTISDQVSAEQSTADNIKSKTTRKNVITALETIGRELKKYKQTPPNGMALFCGNVSEKEGQDDIKLWVLEPPQPLRTRLYRCDQVFILDPLKEMREVQEVYGLLVMDRKEATIGVLEGKQIRMVRKMSSGVPGKIRAGGQSAARFERITEGLAKEFFRRVAESMKEIFFDMPKLKGIIVGGPVPTKEEFLEQGNLVTKLKEMVIGVKDIGNTDESGLQDLVEISKDILEEQEIIKEKKLLEKFFMTLGKNPHLAAYGEEPVKKALSFGAAGTVLISRMLKKEKISEFRALAENTGAEVEMVSTETPEGEQFWNISGIGALLRFAI